MSVWPFRPRLPRAAPLAVKRPPARSRILSDAARELIALFPGATFMSDDVDLNPSMIHLVEKMRADRLALQHILEAEPKDFAEQTRLLIAFQSAVRSIDILSQSANAAEAGQTSRAPISLTGILENTTRALTEEDRAAAQNVAAAAVSAA